MRTRPVRAADGAQLSELLQIGYSAVNSFPNLHAACVFCARNHAYKSNKLPSSRRRQVIADGHGRKNLENRKLRLFPSLIQDQVVLGQGERRAGYDRPGVAARVLTGERACIYNVAVRNGAQERGVHPAALPAHSRLPGKSTVSSPFPISPFQFFPNICDLTMQ